MRKEKVVQKMEAINSLKRFAKGFQKLVKDVYGQSITLERAAVYASLVIDDYGFPGYEIDNFPNCYFPLEK